jgi:hypothetical protein
MTNEDITVYREIGDDGKPKGLGEVFKNGLAAKEERPREKTDFGALFGRICEAADEPFSKEPKQLKI